MITSLNLLFAIIAIIMATAAIILLYSIIFFSGDKGANLQVSKQNILEQIELLYNNKEFGILEMLAKNYLEKVPNHYQVRFYLAKMYFDIGKLYKSIRECELILKGAPQFEEARMLLAKGYRNKNLTQKAIKEYEKVYENHGNNQIAIENLAELYVLTERPQSAITMYNKLITMIDNNSDLANIQLKLAELNEICHDYPAAFEAYKARLELYPNDFDTNKRLIELYIKVKNLEKAAEVIESLLITVEIPSQQIWLIEKLTDVYTELERPEEALKFANQLYNMPEYDNYKARCKVAELQMELENYSEAIEILKDIVDQGQKSLSVLKILAEAYKRHGLYEDSFETYKAMLDIAQPNEAEKIHELMCDLYIEWGKVKFKNKDITEAFRLLFLAVQFNPDNPLVYASLAEINISIKNYNEALVQIKKAIDKDMLSAKHKYCLILAECYHNLDNMYEEKKVLTELVSMKPNNSEAHFRLGLIWEAQHDIEQAKEEFIRASDLDDTLLDAKYHLALIYETHGNTEKALELYHEIIKKDPENHKVLENIKMLEGDDF